MSGSRLVAQRQDRRVTRTRNALIDAYGHLVLHRRKRHIRVTDIVEQADVGRSTFYEHYRSADGLFLEALSRPLAILADAAAGAGDPVKLAALLRHFWENRQRARDMLTGRRGEQVSRLLADMVEARLRAKGIEPAIPLRLAALQMADAAWAPIRGWLLAEAPSTSKALADAICRSGAAIRSTTG